MKVKSRYVCARCGLGVHQWGASHGWKHAAGGPIRSCGKTPVPVDRHQYELELDDEIETLRLNGWSIEEARAEALRSRLEDE